MPPHYIIFTKYLLVWYRRRVINCWTTTYTLGVKVLNNEFCFSFEWSNLK